MSVDSEIVTALRDERPQRSIGLVYQKENELENHYFNARLSEQFDAVIHLDKTSPIRTLDDKEPEEVRNFVTAF